MVGAGDRVVLPDGVSHISRVDWTKANFSIRVSHSHTRMLGDNLKLRVTKEL